MEFINNKYRRWYSVIINELSPNLGDERGQAATANLRLGTVVELYTEDDFGNWS
jgi:hypothetical protein